MQTFDRLARMTARAAARGDIGDAAEILIKAAGFKEGNCRCAERKEWMNRVGRAVIGN
jgi:hypothetical protein